MFVDKRYCIHTIEAEYSGKLCALLQKHLFQIYIRNLYCTTVGLTYNIIQVSPKKPVQFERWSSYTYSASTLHKYKPISSATYTRYNYNASLFVVPLFTTIATPVKCGGRFICTSNLNLHKESSIVWTLRAASFCSVHVIPCIGSTKNIVYLLLLCLDRGCVDPVHIVKVGACGAAKSHPASTILQQKQVPTDRTKVHGRWCLKHR